MCAWRIRNTQSVSFININRPEFRINRILMWRRIVYIKYINKINMNPIQSEYIPIFDIISIWLTRIMPTEYHIPIYSMSNFWLPFLSLTHTHPQWICLHLHTFALSFRMRYFVALNSPVFPHFRRSNPKCIIQRVVAVNILRNSALMHEWRGARERGVDLKRCGMVFEWKTSVSM